MNAEETTALLRKIVAYCPAMAKQIIPDRDGDSDTRRAWTEALAGVSFRDACTAVATLGSRPIEPGETLWIQPGHVIAEVRRIRHRRIEQTEGALTGAPAEASAYLAWLRLSRRALGDGNYRPPQIRATGHTIAELPAPTRRI